MIILIGVFIVFATVLGGFMMGGGHIGSLMHLSEFIVIGGAALGALVIMAPKKVLIDLVKLMILAFKGAPYNRDAYQELLKALYELFLLGRRNGMIALEEHVMKPEASSIFQKYPSFAKNHHALAFLCGGLRPIIDGKIKPDQLKVLMDVEMEAMEHEHEAPISVLTKSADAMPGFGIVAAAPHVASPARAPLRDRTRAAFHVDPAGDPGRHLSVDEVDLTASGAGRSSSAATFLRRAASVRNSPSPGGAVGRATHWAASPKVRPADVAKHTRTSYDSRADHCSGWSSSFPKTSRSCNVLTDTIRQAIMEHGKLVVDATGLDDDADLYDAGLTSLSTVTVMLALEDALELEFPESMLSRRTFSSVSAIRSALEELLVAS